MYDEVQYNMIDHELGLASLSIAQLSERQRVLIEETFGQGFLAQPLTMFYDETCDLVVLNRDHGNYQTYVDLASAYLTAEKSTRLQLFDSIPDCVKGFLGTLELILHRRENG